MTSKWRDVQEYPSIQVSIEIGQNEQTGDIPFQSKLSFGLQVHLSLSLSLSVVGQ